MKAPLLIACLLFTLPLSGHADSTTVFNEIHYHPTADQTEWIELANVMSFDMDLTGWRIEGGVHYAFPKDTIIRAGKKLVIAANPDVVRSRDLFTPVLGPFTGALSNSGERLSLINNAGRIMSLVDYNDNEPWPVAPDGSGASLAKKRPDIDGAEVDSWTASIEMGGTPGGRNFPETPIPPTVRFNEVSPAGEADAAWVEVHSTTNEASIVIGIADDLERQEIVTTLSAGLSLHPLSFPLFEGDLLCLYTADRKSVLDTIRVDTRVRGRSPRYEDRWLYPSQPTPGEANLFDFEESIVINEIMYHSYPEPATPAVPAVLEHSYLTSAWRYWASGSLQGTDWRQIDYDDAAWAQGGPLFSAAATHLPEGSVADTTVATGKTTYYFRTVFDSRTREPDQTLHLRYLMDDSVVFYLNGTEILRDNLPAGDISAGTFATESIADPVWSDPIELPLERLRPGINVLTAEVHQRSFLDNDMAFAAELSLTRTLNPGSPATPFRDRDEEWIELYNRGSTTVDLSAWRFDEGVRYTFPEGITLEPDAYLVIANDAESMRTLYADRAALVIGDFKGGLSNSGERLLLRDRFGNPADSIHYADGGRWPSLADGGGSSLELIDPRADNAHGEAWAASDESAKATWQEIVYRTLSEQPFGLSTWNELNIGMLTAGSVMIDDLRVSEDPDGANRQLLTNGEFKGTLFDSNKGRKWRAVGNHRHSRTVSDPEDPENTVYLVEATGTTDTKHNHVETTFSGNTPLADGHLYEVRLRARWVAGSNQLNIRAYYARLAQTIELQVPRQLGTPGLPNSRRSPNLGPTYDALIQSPTLPEPNEAVHVQIQATDPDGIKNLRLYYAKDGEDFLNVTMVGIDQLFTAEIPAQAPGTVVQFYIEGTDSTGTVSFFPQNGPDSRALYIVDDQRSTGLPLNQLRLIMKEADFDFLLEPLNLLSNERVGCTVLIDEKELVYDTGVRMKGSGAGRARDGASYQGFNIAFPPEHLYRGIHDNISIDRSARAPVVGRPDEIYLRHLFNRAGVPNMFDDVGYFISPTRTHTSLALFGMARYGTVFTESQFEDGDRGAVFNLEITYDPTQTVDRNPESLKTPVPFTHLGTDFRDLGDNKEHYRWPFEIRTGNRADDYSGLIRFCKTMSLPTSELDREIDKVMDVDLWMRTAALYSLCGIGDTWWNGGLQHNMRVYVPEGGSGVIGLPWDLDFVFTSGATSPLKVATGNLRRVMDLPRNTRLYYGHLWNLVNTIFNADYMDPWLSHYGKILGQNLNSQSAYIRSRASYVSSRIEQEAPHANFAITTNGGAPFSVPANLINLAGTGWIDLRRMTLLHGNEETELELAWLSDSNWQTTISLSRGENELILKAFDHEDSLIGSQSITITNTSAGPPNYSEWAAQTFPNGADTGWLADPDNDGLPNGLEYALVTNPLVPTEQSILETKVTDETFEILYGRRRGLNDGSLTVEFSEDLLSWSPTTMESSEILPIDAERERVQAILKRPSSAGYIRLAMVP